PGPRRDREPGGGQGGEADVHADQGQQVHLGVAYPQAQQAPRRGRQVRHRQGQFEVGDQPKPLQPAQEALGEVVEGQRRRQRQREDQGTQVHSEQDGQQRGGEQRGGGHRRGQPRRGEQGGAHQRAVR